MRIFRNKLLTRYNAFIAAVMALLGFSTACDRFPRMEYGTPHASFKVKGKVTSAESNNPVSNLKISIQTDSLSMQLDSAYSDSNGNYEVTDEFGFPISHSYLIHFRDVDGTANGEFQNLDTVVEFKDPVYTGGDKHWDNGETTKEFNVVLKPKK